MNTPPTTTRSARWIAYAKAGAFLLPALLAWWFSTMFLFPKLQQIWVEAGFRERPFLNILRTSNLLMEEVAWIGVGMVLIFGFLEWRGGAWARYRRSFLGVGVWVLNTAILVLLTAMLVSALIAAPALIRR